MSTLNFASFPFVLKLGDGLKSLGKVQNSEWVLQYNLDFMLRELWFVLKRNCSGTIVFATLTIFKPYHFYGEQISVWKVPFAIDQLESAQLPWKVRGAGPTDRPIEVHGVVNLYETEFCDFVDDVLTTISVSSRSALVDFACLLDTDPQGLSDAVLKCAGEEIRVHKCILAARSPVFAATFTSDMAEARSNVVEITDVDPVTLRQVLKFIYSGKTDLSAAMLGDLLYAADKYRLIELKALCVDELKSSLTVGNVFDVLVLGDLHDEGLRDHAKRYICENFGFSKLEETVQWKSLVKERKDLATEVLTASLKYKEDLIAKKARKNCKK